MVTGPLWKLVGSDHLPVPYSALAPSVGGVGPWAQQQRHVELLGLICDGEDNLREAKKTPEDGKGPEFDSCLP